MPFDCRGLELTAASDEAVCAFDGAIDAYLRMQRDTADHLKATFAADGDMPMAKVLKTYFFMLMASAPLHEKAKIAIADLHAVRDSVNERERLHIDAATHWVAGRKGLALATWEALLVHWPLDVLALRLAHHGHFYEGDSANVRDTVARRLHAWSADVPSYGCVTGMLAFGLEETGSFDRAVDAGQEALAYNPDDPWAIHAVAHVHESRNAPRKGIEWIDANADGWQGANNFRYHVLWHKLLMQLELGDYDGVLQAYDDALWDEETDEYLDYVNDAALLLRLELHGQDVGTRWNRLAEKCRHRAHDHALAFIDAHYAIAFASAEPGGAKDLIAAMESYSGARGDDNAWTTRTIGLPTANAIAAYRAGDFDATVETLMPIRYEMQKMGGSHAQRDVFSMLLIDAAMRAGRPQVAKMLLSERLVSRPNESWANARMASN